ncbi:deiodinase-like protein [Rhodophyticola sp. CCM32]|uniref:deiodinase-like protein n=1 Tax=Rhodophyticola sp. CCM32 TaxID=2916397 RepID=UPI00143DE3F5|nr:deiodinase-like protein [Rhodophyticola sp. CCM32]
MSDYNYDAFSSRDYDFDISTGPMPGEKAPDFPVSTSSGEERHLLDFDGDFLVLETGSITCPLFQSRRRMMGALEAEFPGISNAVLYVREAHPGAAIPSHDSFEDKRACANRLREEDGEARLVLVDGIEGAAHNAYGGMPNAVFIINRNGCVLFRSDWNNPSATRQALATLIAGGSVRARSYFRPAVPTTVLRTLGRAGKGAWPDFLRGLPVLIWCNLIKRNIRLAFNRPPALTRDTTC